MVISGGIARSPFIGEAATDVEALAVCLKLEKSITWAWTKNITHMTRWHNTGDMCNSYTTALTAP